MRDFRIINQNQGQQISYDEVVNRMNRLVYRDLGVLAKTLGYDSGKAIITSGLRVTPNSGMIVTIGNGAMFQRQGDDLLPCLMPDDIDVTIAAATGVARTDMIEVRVASGTGKEDYVNISTVVDSIVTFSDEAVDKDYYVYLEAQAKSDTTTATAATAGELTGTVEIATTIDLSTNYLIRIADGEDGDAQDIDCRGATPAATTKAEIISAINTAVGRTIASISGNYIKLTGSGTGQVSQFTLTPPRSVANVDATDDIFGLPAVGVYKYTYFGQNEWIKICEIDVGASTTTITSGLIRNIDQKLTWSNSNFFDTILLDQKLFKQTIENYNTQIFTKNVVSTYALAYTVSSAYAGGVLSPNGDIHFIPYNAAVGQKISASGVVSTYALVYTNSNAYAGGVLSPNGDIHFIPFMAAVGQKISASGVVSTYALVYTGINYAYAGGVLSPNGDIHFIPFMAAVGQKISASGVVSTYALVYTGINEYAGGVLLPNGNIHFIPHNAPVGQKILTLSSESLGIGYCCSPFFNKF